MPNFQKKKLFIKGKTKINRSFPYYLVADDFILKPQLTFYSDIKNIRKQYQEKAKQFYFKKIAPFLSKINKLKRLLFFRQHFLCYILFPQFAYLANRFLNFYKYHLLLNKFWILKINKILSKIFAQVNFFNLVDFRLIHLDDSFFFPINMYQIYCIMTETLNIESLLNLKKNKTIKKKHTNEI